MCRGSCDSQLKQTIEWANISLFITVASVLISTLCATLVIYMQEKTNTIPATITQYKDMAIILCWLPFYLQKLRTLGLGM